MIERFLPGAEDQRPALRHYAAMIALLLFALLPGFFSIPTMDRDEARYSQAATQMMETGDFIDIRFQEQPRYVKPVGIYWMQVATATPFGGADAPIWAYRLPSLFGILIAAVATAWIGARLASARLGIFAGVVLGLTLACAVEARTAKTDAMLLASGAVAQAALFVLLVRTEGKPKFIGAPLIFWLATGAALIIKGPIVTMVSATTVIGYGLWMRDWGVVRRLRLLPGIAVAAAVALPWIIAITIQTGGAFIEESVGHALLGKVAEGDDSHGGPPGYHTLLLPATFWPGTVFLGLAAMAAWTRRGEPSVRFLLAWLLPTWVIFELVATKLPHYVLPTFPAIALLAALGVKDMAAYRARPLGRRLFWIGVGLFGLISLVLVILPFAAAISFDLPPVSASRAIAALFALVAGAAGVAAALRLSKGRLTAFFVAIVGTYAALLASVVPRLDPLWPSYHLARAVDRLEGCDSVLSATAGYREPSNAFWLGTATPLSDGQTAAGFLLEGDGCRVAAVEAREREAFETRLGGAPVRTVGQVTGTNAVKGREMVIDLYVLADSPLEEGPPRRGLPRQ